VVEDPEAVGGGGERHGDADQQYCTCLPGYEGSPALDHGDSLSLS
jgi:hypothetical protein